MVHRTEVIQRVIVFERATGQCRAVAGLDDFAIRDAVGDFTLNPFATYATAQGPVVDVVGELAKDGFGGGLDIWTQFERGTGFRVGQAIDPVLVATLA